MPRPREGSNNVFAQNKSKLAALVLNSVLEHWHPVVEQLCEFQGRTICIINIVFRYTIKTNQKVKNTIEWRIIHCEPFLVFCVCHEKVYVIFRE